MTKKAKDLKYGDVVDTGLIKNLEVRWVSVFRDGKKVSIRFGQPRGRGPAGPSFTFDADQDITVKENK